MDCEQNLRESSVKVISLLTICVKREIREWQYPPFFVILSEKLNNVSVISREIAEITGIKHNAESLYYHFLDIFVTE